MVGLRLLAVLVPVMFGLEAFSGSYALQNRVGFPMDDPYIHFQFARNLATGAGFSFNPGEPTPGATSPLWVVLLAGGHMLGFALEPLAIGLGLAAAAGAALLTLEVGIACGLPALAAFGAALAVGASGRFTWAGLSGMETTLATALALAVIRVQFSGLGGTRRALVLGLLCGLAAQARPEMLLLAPLVAVLEWRRASENGDTRARVRELLLLALAVLVVVAPYTIFSLVTVGRPLPNTFYAKSLLPLGGPDLAALRLDYLPELHFWIRSDNLVLGILVIPGLLLWLFRRGPQAGAIVALWPLVFCAYAIALYPRHFSLSRYTIPLLPMIALLAMAPVEFVLVRIRSHSTQLVMAAALAVAALAGAWSAHAAFRGVYLGNVDNILRMQVAMGDWVAANLPANARVATNDVGAIGWYGRRKVFDTVGLVSGDLITLELEAKRRDGRADPEAILPGWFAQVRPDVAILFPNWYPNLTQSPWLEKVHAIQYPNNTGGGDELVVYRLVGPPE